MSYPRAAHAAFALAALMPLAVPAAGVLDPSFGANGRAALDLTPAALQGEHGSALAIRSDGKLIVVSETANVDPHRVVVSRHNANGSLDTTFGTGGQAVLDFGACAQCSLTSPSVVMLGNGSIVVAASESIATLASLTSISNIVVTRLTVNGAVDTAFGQAGVSRINPSGHSVVYDIAAQSDGRILVAGSSGPSGLMASPPPLPPALAPGNWLVTRLDASGSVDATFIDRVASSPEIQAPSAAQRIRLQSDGTIVVLGRSAAGLRAYRYSAATPLSTYPVTARGDFSDLAIDAQDRVWALAASQGGSQLIRLTAQLALDTTYPAAPLPPDVFLVSVLPLSTGEAFLAGGRGFVTPNGLSVSTAGVILKLDASGRVDPSFGDGGRVSIDRSIVNRLALQANGRAVAVGYEAAPPVSNTGDRLALLRIDPAVPGFVSTEWLGYPVQSLGTRSVAQAVTVYNSSAAPRTVSFTASASFEVEGCSGSLAAGASCQLSITYRPTTSAAELGYMDFAVDSLAIADSGGTQATLRLYTSAEKSLVQHFYRSILRRDADSGGWGFWNAEARRMRSELDASSGATGTNTTEAWFAMAMSFFASAEYTNRSRDDDAYLADLYRTFFDRAADSGGVEFWRGQIALGLPREMILNAFLFSSEFAALNATYFGGAATRPEVDLVLDMYRGLLGRLPDTAGLTYWVPRLQRAQCRDAASVRAEADAISSAFATSGEYTARGHDNSRYVADLYNAFLRRAGDASGFGFWKSELDKATLTREAARGAFLGSVEFAGRIERVIAAGCRSGA